MPKFNFKVGKGVEEYIKQLGQLYDSNDEVMRSTIYAGANLVADEMKSAIRGIPTDNSTKGSTLKGINKIQKAGLIDSFGIAPMRDDGGFRNVKLGFDGYNKLETKKFPQGQANSMIARSVESGTSFRAKHPFIAPTVRKTKAAAELAMIKEYDDSVRKIFNK